MLAIRSHRHSFFRNGRCLAKSPKAFHLQMGTMMIGATDSGKSELTRGLATAFGSLDSQRKHESSISNFPQIWPDFCLISTQIFHMILM